MLKMSYDVKNSTVIYHDSQQAQATIESIVDYSGRSATIDDTILIDSPEVFLSIVSARTIKKLQERVTLLERR